MIQHACRRLGAACTPPVAKSRAALVWPVVALAALVWTAPPLSAQSLPVPELDAIFASLRPPPGYGMAPWGWPGTGSPCCSGLGYG